MRTNSYITRPTKEIPAVREDASPGRYVILRADACEGDNEKKRVVDDLTRRFPGVKVIK